MQSEKVFIRDEYITLGQFLKLAGIIDTGGQAKSFLEEALILVNGVKENRRGKKLYPDDRVEINGIGSFTVARS